MDSMKGSAHPSMKRTPPAKSRMPSTPASSPNPRATPDWGRTLTDNLGRNVMAEHEADLATLPPGVRASRTPEQWLATPPLEILRLAREAKQKL